MSLVFWTSYTATARGVRLKQVCCEKCGGYYYYEMIRAARGKAIAIYNIDTMGAADQSAKAAGRALHQSLVKDRDGIPCPTCGHLQSNMPMPAVGMPPALIWVSQTQPDGSDGGYLATARPQPIPTGTLNSVVFQLPRVTLPEACCNCGKPASATLKVPFQIGDTPGNLGLKSCDECTAKLRSSAFLAAMFGWMIAGILGFLVYSLVPEETRQGERWVAFAGVTLVIGFVSTIALPSMLVTPFSFAMLDAKRLIARLRFRNARYAGIVAATVIRTNNLGPLFTDETANQAQELANITE